MSELEAPPIDVETRRSPVYLSAQNVGLPLTDDLEEILLAIEDRIDEWVGRRVAPTQYTEDDVTNGKGIALLNHYPVLSVEEIALHADRFIGADPTPMNPSLIGGIWRQDRRLYLGSAGMVVRVRYTAGLQPIPRIFTTVALTIFNQARERSPTGDISFLEIPYQEREVSSVSLPGGLSKSFRTYRPNTPSASGSGAGGSITELDRLLAPLAKYQYCVIAT